MKYTELKKSILEGIKGVYLLEGDDAYFRDKGEEIIKTPCLQMPELDFTAFDGTALKGSALTALTSAVCNFPFCSDRRVVKVSEFYPSDSDYEKYLKNTFEAMPQTSVLIIVNSQSKKGCDLKKKKCITYVDCNRVDSEDVAKWVYVTLRRAGVNCSSEAATAVAEYCVRDMARVDVETKKLLSSGKTVISLADVNELVYKDAEYRVYEMTGTIPRRNYTQFCEIYTELLSKGMEKTAILTSILSYLRNLLTVINSNESDAVLASTLKMKEYGVKKSREQAKLIGKATLESHVAKLYDCISSIKGGLLSVDGAFYAAINEIFFKTA